MSMTFLQKLEWLEGALAFAQKLQEAPTRTLQDMKAAYAKSSQAKDSSTAGSISNSPPS
jgi:hypothetical protein